MRRDSLMLAKRGSAKSLAIEITIKMKLSCNSSTLRHGYNLKTRQKYYFFIPGRCRKSNLTNFGEVITMEIIYHSMQYHCHSNHN